MKQIKVRFGNRTYPIKIGRGLLKRTGTFLRELKVGQKVMVVSNKRVARDSGFLAVLRKSILRAGFECVAYELPHGTEKDKSETELLRLWKAMFRAGLDRKSALVALGGGVVGDAAGFAASTYVRGIHLVHVPTTLLAQVDSAVGGKTAIDLADAKNMVGTFYQPRLVLSDLDTLTRLDLSVFQNSFAEVIKYGVIRDPSLFQLLEHYGTTFLSHVAKKHFSKEDFSFLEEIVYRSARIKASVVERDEKETKGERIILNYGHTFAHALEGISHYELPHGEAVGLGMILASRLAERLGLADLEFAKRQFSLINALCPSSSLRFLVKRYRPSWPKVKSLFSYDKKALDGIVRFVLPIRLGKVKVVTIQKDHWHYVRGLFQAVGMH